MSNQFRAWLLFLAVLLTGCSPYQSFDALADAGAPDASPLRADPYARPIGPAGGDLNSSFPAPGVAGIQGKPVPVPTGTNTALMWNGTALGWTNPSSGSVSITGSGLAHATAGTLDSASYIGTAGQFAVTNAAANNSAWATCAGDVSCSTTTPGLFTVSGLRGHTFPTPTGTGTNLQWSGSAFSWAASGGGGSGPPAGSNFIYVTQGGNDTTGNGTFGQPYLTLGKANVVVKALAWPEANISFTIFIGPGIYNENLSLLPNVSYSGMDLGAASVEVTGNVTLDSAWVGYGDTGTTLSGMVFQGGTFDANFLATGNDALLLFYDSAVFEPISTEGFGSGFPNIASEFAAFDTQPTITNSSLETAYTTFFAGVVITASTGPASWDSANDNLVGGLTLNGVSQSAAAVLIGGTSVDAVTLNGTQATYTSDIGSIPGSVTLVGSAAGSQVTTTGLLPAANVAPSTTNGQVLTTVSGIAAWASPGTSTPQANIMYVSTSGNDTTCNGSIGAPCATYGKSVTLIGAAATSGNLYAVQFGPGSYSENLQLAPWITIVGFDLSGSTALTGTVGLASSFAGATAQLSGISAATLSGSVNLNFAGVSSTGGAVQMVQDLFTSGFTVEGTDVSNNAVGLIDSNLEGGITVTDAELNSQTTIFGAEVGINATSHNAGWASNSDVAPNVAVDAASSHFIDAFLSNTFVGGPLGISGTGVSYFATNSGIPSNINLTGSALITQISYLSVAKGLGYDDTVVGPTTGALNVQDAIDYIKSHSSGGISQITGDVTAGPGSGSQAATVVGIQGDNVPAPSGTNTALEWSGTALAWVNPASPISVSGTGLVHVTAGSIDSTEYLGTAGQSVYTNAAANASVWASCSGDVTCSTTTVGKYTVTDLQTYPVTLASPSSGQALVGSGSAWHPGAVNLAGGSTFVTGTLPSANLPGATTTALGVVELAGDLSGTDTVPSVVSVHGTTVPAGGALTTGNQLIVSGASAATWSALNLAGGSGFVSGVLPTANQANQTLGGDLSGITSSGTVVGLRGDSLPAPSGTNTALEWSGTALQWVSPSSPISVSGTGLVHVTSGTIDSSAYIGTAGQFAVTNAGATGSAWATCSGDVSCATATPADFTVTKVDGASIPAAGALVTGNAPYVSGVSALTYGPLNLSGGSGWVSGVLPSANQAAQTMLGDVTGTTVTSVVAKVHGATVPVAGALTTGNGLYVSGASALSYSALNLAGGPSYVNGLLPAGNQSAQTMGGDVTGTTAASEVVSALSGKYVFTTSGLIMDSAIVTPPTAVSGTGILATDPVSGVDYLSYYNDSGTMPLVTLGSLPGMGAIWLFEPIASRALGNYALGGDGTNTFVNAPGVSGSVSLGAGNVQYSTQNVAALSPPNTYFLAEDSLFVGSFEATGGGVGVFGMTYSSAMPVSSPSAGFVEASDSQGVHVFTPSGTGTPDQIISPQWEGSFVGGAASQSGNIFAFAGVTATSSTATPTTIITIPFPTVGESAGITVRAVGVIGNRSPASSVYLTYTAEVEYDTSGLAIPDTALVSRVGTSTASMNTCTITFSVSGTNLLIKVVGVSTDDISWTAYADVIYS